MIIVLVGPPGSGKGTQSTLISKELKLPCLATGDILREEISKKTPLGLNIEDRINEGRLVETSLINQVISNRVKDTDCEKGFILDGYPRKIDQAIELEKMIAPRKIDKVVGFLIDDETIIKRIAGRFSCTKCNANYNKYYNAPKIENVCDNCGSEEFYTRKDDTSEVCKKRLEEYHLWTEPLFSYYEKQGTLVKIDSSKNIEDITKTILKNILTF